ncbi:MAG: bifunctional nicotinamidase/pyrazinamidase, partial [Deltaproteobacteria bacterium]|nr:bifunctional nicotinamidase/pyrazinamidase [Deltaproteobacteria bacterium]
DLQYGFCPGGALAVACGDETIAVATAVIPKFDIVIATQDWHPPHHKSFAINNPGTRVGELGELGGLPQVMWPPHCVQDTPGAELHADLPRDRITHVVRKGTDPEIDSYSAFFDNGKRKATGLGDWLRAHDVTELYVLGLATDYCVKFTVLDALELGFEVWLIEDGCRPVDLAPGDGERAIAAMRAAGATIVDSAQLA